MVEKKVLESDKEPQHWKQERDMLRMVHGYRDEEVADEVRPDIVERLTSWHAAKAGNLTHLLNDAKDEIVRLRREVEDWKGLAKLAVTADCGITQSKPVRLR